MPFYNDIPDEEFMPRQTPLVSSLGIGPKVTKAISGATREWLDEHPEATTTVQDYSISTIKLANGAVTHNKMAVDSVGHDNLIDGSVQSDTIADGAVTTSDIADGAVTEPKIADYGVTTQKLANRGVTTDKLADQSVTADKLVSDAIDAMPTMSTAARGVAKVGGGLRVVNDTLELDGTGDIASAVSSWLDSHPEAVTTVTDGSVDINKLSSVLLDQLMADSSEFFETNLLKFNFSTLPGATSQGLRFELDSKQQLHVYGSSTVAGVYNAFMDIDLEAGRYGYGTAITSSGVVMQARKIVNGQDAGYVDGITGGTGSIGYFTLSERTTVRIRIAFSPVTDVDRYLQPMLIKTDFGMPGFYIEPIQMRSRIPNQMLDHIGCISAGTDLLYFHDVGIWNINAGTYVNSPDDSETIYGVFINMRREALLYQVLINFNYATHEAVCMHHRRLNLNDVHQTPWIKVGPRHDISFHGTLANGEDFNDKTTGGVWTIATGQQFENGPSFKVQSGGTLVVFGRSDENNQQTYQVVFAYFDGKTYMRRRTGNPGSYVWGNWVVVGEDEHVHLVSMISYAEPVTQGSTAVVGPKVKVMSYNVAQWDNDTTTDISDEQLARVKQMLMYEDCDILGLQECPGSIDTNGGNTKNVNEYLFYPNYPYTWIQDVTIASRTPLTDKSVHTLGTGRKYSHAKTVISDRVVSIYCVHPYPGSDPDRTALRHHDWEEFASIINADDSDYVVCLGDFNTFASSVVEDDMDTFDQTFSGWTKANGGYLGWYETTGRYSPNMPADNILVNGNVAMTCMRPLSEWYDLLYSDHVPVVATLVLKNL